MMLNIACIDVYYYDKHANTSCVVFQNDTENTILKEYQETILDVHEYVPGQFYKREMPCILKVLEKVEEPLDLIIVDSFVWLEQGKPGLGAHLYEALDHKLGIIGVAKTLYKGSTKYKEVRRGESTKPLYVSTIGYDLDKAVELVNFMKGRFRIPDVLKRVDQLSRESEFGTLS